jgi:hypothetical protein
MIPTVAELSPDRKAYTISGSFSSSLWTPRESPYIPAAPGRLSIQQAVSSPLPIYEKRWTDLQRRKTKRAGINPAWINAMQKSILVLPGPGKAWHSAKSS